MSYWYLASPIQNLDNPDDTSLPKARCRAASHKAAELVMNGIPVYCPALVSQTMREVMPSVRLSMEHEAWLDFDKKFLQHAKGVIVYMLDGWRESPGIKEEIAFAYEHNKPIIMLSDQLSIHQLKEYVGHME